MPLVLEHYWDLPLSNLLTVDQFSFEEDKSTEFIMWRKKIACTVSLLDIGPSGLKYPE